MNDGIQSIRFVPQINRLNQKGRTSDKKGNNESKKDFSEHMSANDNDVESKGHNQAKEDYENTEHKKQNDENILHEKTEDDFDNNCGSILDAEI